MEAADAAFHPDDHNGSCVLIWAPETLSRRLRFKEERVKQKGVVALSGILFVASFILAGLDFRFGWSEVPGWVTWPAGSIFLLSYGVYAEVMRENEWLSRSIEVMEGQKVVSTGLYGIVCHPMYTATILMFLAMPLVMGSWWAFLAMIPYVIAIVTRITEDSTALHAHYTRPIRQDLSNPLCPRTPINWCRHTVLGN